MARKFIFSWSIALMITHFAGAQTLTYKLLSNETGLPSNTIFNVFKDSKGYIWISTKNGACKWDSKNFTYYTISDGLPNNEVYQVFEDSDGRIWFSTFNKTLSFLYNGKIHNSDNDPLLRSFEVYPASLITEYKKELYFISSGKMLSKFNLSNHHITHYNAGKLLSHAFLIRSKGKVFAVEHNNKSDNKVISPDTSYLEKAYITTNPVKDDTLSKIYYDEKRYTISTGFDSTFYHGTFTSPDLKNVIYNNGNIAELYKDSLYFIKSKHTIIGDQFISTISIENMLFSHIKGGGGLLFCRQIPILEVRPENKISNNLKFIFKYKNKIYGLNDEHQIIDIANQKIVNALEKDPINTYNLQYINDNYYLCTSRNIYKFKTPLSPITSINTQIKLPNYKFIERTKNNRFFIANGFEGGLLIGNTTKVHFDSLALVKNLSVYTAFEDSRKRLWYATPDKVYVRNNLNESQTEREFPLNKGIALFCRRIREDKEGNIFFVTNAGIYVYDNIKIYKLDITNLLTDNECNELLIDELHSTFWVASKNGLCQIKYQKKSDTLHFQVVNKFFTTDGLFSNIINDIILDSNNIYIATEKGLNILNNLLYKPDTISIPIYMHLTAVNGSDMNADPQRELSLKFNQNNLTISFSAIYFKRRDRLKLYARLFRNGSLISVNLLTEDKIDYYSLNDGNYRLEITAKDQDYTYIKGTSLPFEFTIRPPYYKTWWFIGFVAISLIIITASIMRWNSNRKKARALVEAELKAQLNESTLKSLQSQMNPHFVFNSLNTIQHFITSKDDKGALNYLSDFSNLMRRMLEHSVHTLISLENEIQFLKQYMLLESIRFQDTFNVTWDIELDEEDLIDIYIPTMLIQPILENAVKHGVSNLIDKKGKIEILFALQHENLLFVQISNTGKINAHKSTKGNSIALQTIKERLNIYTKNNIKGEYNLIIHEYGATATITIPI